jgi:hypothetical protein
VQCHQRQRVQAQLAQRPAGQYRDLLLRPDPGQHLLDLPAHQFAEVAVLLRRRHLAQPQDERVPGRGEVDLLCISRRRQVADGGVHRWVETAGTAGRGGFVLTHQRTP